MTTDRHPVTVLGLGAMGRALAGAFLAAGHPTTVWNRSPGRADELVAAGAAEVESVADALDPSAVTVLCLLDRAAVDAVLDAAGDRLAGATVVNLTSATPEDARAVGGRVEAAGGRFLAGTIMVTTPMVGTDDALVLYSGDAAVFERCRPTLGSLGGEADLLGPDPGLAAAYDLGMLHVFFQGMTSFLHAAALLGADGVAAEAFVPYAGRMLDLLRPVFGELAGAVDLDEHPGTEDRLAMELRGLEHIEEASRSRGLDVTLPGALRALAASAVDAGHGEDGFSRLVDVLRTPSTSAR